MVCELHRAGGLDVGQWRSRSSAPTVK